jgi:hypothetical protein
LKTDHASLRFSLRKIAEQLHGKPEPFRTARWEAVGGDSKWWIQV